ncbi:MAG: biotin--[acetyl-CoA-carboxylase] ligase, partial [Nitrospinota bacterium]
VQYQGRGQRGRSFCSPPGGLYFSLLLRPPLSPPQAPPLTLLAGVAVARGLRRLTGLPIGLRWPNDLVLHHKKVGGILVEMELKGGEIAFLIIGVGINVHTRWSDFPEPLRPSVITLAAEYRQPLTQEQLLCELLLELETWYTTLLSHGMAPILDTWRALAVGLGEPVRLKVGTEEITGIVHGIDAAGNLVVRDQQGRVRTVAAGEYNHP